MTQPIHLIADIYCMPIPDKYAQINIDPVFNELYWWSHEGIETTIPLPQGNWQIICTTKEITEEQAKGIVRELPVGQRWHNYNGDYPVWWHTAKESLRSLVTSKGFNPESNYLIIKKVS